MAVRKPKTRVAGVASPATQSLLRTTADLAAKGQRQRSELLRKAAARIRAARPPLTVEEREMIATWLDRLSRHRVALEIFKHSKAVGRPKGDRKPRRQLYEDMPVDDRSLAYYHWHMVNVQGIRAADATARMCKDLGISRSTLSRAVANETDVELFSEFQKPTRR